MAKITTTDVTTSPAPGVQPVVAKPGLRLANDVRIGNQAMLRRLSRTTPHVQFKLQIGAVNDPLEAEADRVADHVMRMSDPGVSVAASSPQISRKCAGCEEEEDKKLHAKPEGASLPGEAPPIVHDVLRSPGQPLDAASRAFFEPQFGTGLGDIRIHSDGDAGRSAKSVSALAYTVGRDIVFAPGQYQPQIAEGKRLLAHELTHVAQQGLGRPSQLHRQAEDAGAAAAGGAGAAGAAAGAAGAATCSPPSHCPSGFCVPMPLPKIAVGLARDQAAPGLLAGIAVFVSPRVVPVWTQYLFGGSGPQNFTSTFGADFASSTTTDNAMTFLELELVKSLKATPPTFPPGVNTTTEDIPARVPAAIKALGTPDVPGEMDFSAPGEIPGNLAGGIGKGEAACPVGAKPSPFDDDRTAKGTANITSKADGSMDVDMSVMFHVTDTVDLCPGDCGAPKEQLATLPMSRFEASGVSGDVPFTVDFAGSAKSFTIPAPGSKPAPAPTPPPTPGPAPGVTPPNPPPPPGAEAAPESSP